MATSATTHDAPADRRLLCGLSTAGGVYARRQRVDGLSQQRDGRLRPVGAAGETPQHVLFQAAEPRRAPDALVRESDVSPYKTFVENARWDHDRTLFFTVHVVGSHNNFRPQDRAALIEANERMQANVAWMRDSFRVAREGGYKAVVVAMHAQMLHGDDTEDGPFGAIIDELKLGSERFGGQDVARARRFAPVPGGPAVPRAARRRRTVALHEHHPARGIWRAGNRRGAGQRGSGPVGVFGFTPLLVPTVPSVPFTNPAARTRPRSRRACCPYRRGRRPR